MRLSGLDDQLQEWSGHERHVPRDDQRVLTATQRRLDASETPGAAMRVRHNRDTRQPAGCIGIVRGDEQLSSYRAKRVRNYRDYLEIDKTLAYLSWLYQSNRGVLMAPGAEENWTLSVQHSVEDVQRYIDNFSELARDLRA